MNCNHPVTQPGPTLARTCGGSSFMLFMGLLEVFIRSQCDPCERPVSRNVPDREYDFIVVGAGSAGAVVASRLSEVPHWRVLLVEAGGNEPTGTQVPSMFLNFLGTSIDWGFRTEPEDMACLAEKERRCYWARGKVLGGTSVLNAMLYIRGSRKDYDDWENLGNSGWGFRDVLPYFLKSEDNLQVDMMDPGFHGVGGYLPVSQFPYNPLLSQAILQAGRELGYPTRDLNGRRHAGFTICQTTSKNGERYSTSRAFLWPIKDRPNLHILMNTVASRVLVDPVSKRAYGVEVIRDDGRKEEIIASKEVVLSAGAVNSPHLLLLSGIGPTEDLTAVNVSPVHHLPGVGKNLQNHVSFFMWFTINDTATNPLHWETAMNYILSRDGPMSNIGILDVTGFVNSKYVTAEDDHPDIQLFFNGLVANCSKTGTLGETIDYGVTLADGTSPKQRVNINPVVLRPVSRGYITLRDSDPLSPPKIFARYLTNPADVAVLLEGIKFGLNISKTAALQKYGFELDTTPAKGCEALPFGSDAYWECAIRSNTGPENHQAGSCKMGPAGDREAVVDPELRVHGVDRLRVMDASIMPSVVSGNTNAPVIMIAEKGSDMVKRRWL